MTRDEKLILVSFLTGRFPSLENSSYQKARSRLIAKGLITVGRSDVVKHSNRRFNQHKLTSLGRRAAIQAMQVFKQPVTPIIRSYRGKKHRKNGLQGRTDLYGVYVYN